MDVSPHTIPDVVVRRLPIYARSLAYLAEEGVHSVSSQELGDRIGVTAAQIRKDLSYFGEFGKQGIGYNVEYLLGHIRRILGLNEAWPMVLVGAGLLGQAIARYEGFRARGMDIVGVFDTDATKIGLDLGALTVQPYAELSAVLQHQKVQLAIVAVPANDAQAVVDDLVQRGVRAILNYAPIVVQVPQGVWVRHIDPVALLHSMTYYLAREEEHNGLPHAFSNLEQA